MSKKLSLNKLFQAIYLISLLTGVSGSAQAAISKGHELKLPQEIRNWGLENSYQSHIQARKAWALSKGSRDIVVAVIDTGIDPDHPALKNSLWQKPGAKEKEYGWDFVRNVRNPSDRNGHGTHIAGIIGALEEKKSGIIGVAPQVSIMALRFYSEELADAEIIANSVKAVEYAIENGAHIINYSAGGSSFSERERAVFAKAHEQGILVIAAAGNRGRNADKAMNKFYPASYGFPNIISVAASNIQNELVTSSNWGPETVHLSAPGEAILSTLPGGRYGYLTGTSQGAAFVTGAAVLMMAKNESLRGKPEKLKKMLLASTDKIPSLQQKVLSGGRLNARAALESALQAIGGPIPMPSRIPSQHLPASLR